LRLRHTCPYVACLTPVKRRSQQPLQLSAPDFASLSIRSALRPRHPFLPVKTASRRRWPTSFSTWTSGVFSASSRKPSTLLSSCSCSCSCFGFHLCHSLRYRNGHALLQLPPFGELFHRHRSNFRGWVAVLAIGPQCIWATHCTCQSVLPADVRVLGPGSWSRLLVKLW
jgi:hypothetical protein